MKLTLFLIIIFISWSSLANPICQKLLEEIHRAQIMPEFILPEQKKVFSDCAKLFQEEEALCKKGRAYSCHTQAYFLSMTKPDSQEDQWELYNKACKKKYPEACFMLAKLRFELQNRRPPISIFEKHCRKKSNLACWRAARAFALTADYDKALKNIKLSCRHGDKMACARVLTLRQGVENAIEKSLLLKQVFLKNQKLDIEPEEEKVITSTKPKTEVPKFCNQEKKLIRSLEKEKRIFVKHLAEFFNQAYPTPMAKKDFKNIRLRYLTRLGVVTSFELMDAEGTKVRPQVGSISASAKRAFLTVKRKPKVYSSRLSNNRPVTALPVFKNKQEIAGLFFLGLRGIDEQPKSDCKTHLDRLLGLYIFARSKLYMEQLQFNELNAEFLSQKEGIQEYYFINSLGKIINPEKDRGKDIKDSFSSKAYDELIRNSLDKPFFIESDSTSANIAHSVKREGQIISSGILTLKFKTSK